MVEKQGKLLEDLSKDSNKKVFYVDGSVSAEERENVRKVAEENNDVLIIASYGTFSTGINIKNLHNVIFASPTKSRVRSLQSIGRGLRKSLNKSRVTIYDLVDDIKYKNKENYTLKHFKERLKIYVEEKFKFKMYDYDL
jgi:superfamily II DNA or RNA helicase